MKDFKFGLKFVIGLALLALAVRSYLDYQEKKTNV